MQVAHNLGELEAVRGGQRQDDAVLGRGRLQLEIELAAEAFSQRQPPGAIDTAAEGGMDDELHAAGFVEEALQNDVALRGQTTKRGARRGEIVHKLTGSRRAQTESGGKVMLRVIAGRLAAQPRGKFPTKSGHRRGELVAAPRRLTQPEGNGRWCSLCILDPHQPALHAQNAICRVAQLKHVTGEALDGKVLVYGANYQALRFENHLKVSIVGNGAAGGQGRETRAPAPAQHAVDKIAMDECTAPATTRRKAFAQHCNNSIELGAVERAIGPGTPAQAIQLLLAPFARGDLRHDLLSQDVQRLMRDGDAIEFAALTGL